MGEVKKGELEDLNKQNRDLKKRQIMDRSCMQHVTRQLACQGGIADNIYPCPGLVPLAGTEAKGGTRGGGGGGGMMGASAFQSELSAQASGGLIKRAMTSRVWMMHNLRAVSHKLLAIFCFSTQPA